MEEGKGPTTSTAAAVADGANAVSATKCMSNSNSSSQISINTSSTSVRLLIKASNQQHDDMFIESDLLWSVKRLKIYLSSVHPSKPLVHEQKLIYSGQLLKDQLLLKEVIRSYKDVYTQNHIIHLVCPNENISMPSLSKINRVQGTFNRNTITNENDNTIRQRRVNVESTTRQSSYVDQRVSHHNLPQLPSNNNQQTQRLDQGQQCQSQQQQTMPRMVSKCTQVSNVNNCQLFLHQQAAMYNWLHQVYCQYMEHCVRLSNVSSNVSNDSNNIRNSEITSYPPNIIPYMTQPFSVSYLYDNSTERPTVIRSTDSNGDSLPNAVNAEMSSNTRTPLAQRPSQQQTPVQANSVGDAATGQYSNIVQDETDNHDWLDVLFTFIRLLFFLTLLYLNSSTQRCMVVFVIAAVMYCYHIGIFRRLERNNNNLNRNNNADRDAPNPSPSAPTPTSTDVQQQNYQNEHAINNSADQNNGQSNVDNTTAATFIPDPSSEANSNNNTSMTSALAFIQTFIVTFFTSLFPETPAL